jgi:hypothetical protein
MWWNKCLVVWFSVLAAAANDTIGLALRNSELETDAVGARELFFLRRRRKRIAPCDGSVERLELIQTNLNSKITDLANGTVVETDLPAYNINAIVTGNKFGSVQFGYNSTVRYNVENTALYAFCRNSGNCYFQCSVLTFGTHVITVTPFADTGGRGQACPSYRVQFSIAQPSTSVPLGAPAAPNNGTPMAQPPSNKDAPMAQPPAPVSAPVASPPFNYEAPMAKPPSSIDAPMANSLSAKPPSPTN